MRTKPQDSKAIQYLGWAATFMSVVMYVSYIAQIQDNLAGHKGTFIQPLAACLNCVLWTLYGLFSKPKNWPIVAANVPGIVLGFLATITAL